MSGIFCRLYRIHREKLQQKLINIICDYYILKNKTNLSISK